MEGKFNGSAKVAFDRFKARGDEITFHLRPNLKFSDDTPVNAEAVKLYLERAKTQGDQRRIAEAEKALASKRQFLDLAERAGG